MNHQKFLMTGMILFALLLVGCTVPGATSTPVAIVVTATPEGTSRPGGTATPQTTRIPASPILAPLLAKTPVPSPVPQINMKELGDKLNSFTFDLMFPDKEGFTLYQGKWVRSPESWEISFDLNKNQGRFTYVAIEGREWVVIFDANLPILCTDWQKEPKGSLVYVACNAGITQRKLLEGILTFLFQKQDARFVSGITEVDNIPSYTYTWQDQEGKNRYMYLAVETGLPILFDAAFQFRLSHHNDPTINIKLPTSVKSR